VSSSECNVCSGTACCSSCVIAAVASVIIVRHRPRARFTKYLTIYRKIIFEFIVRSTYNSDNLLKFVRNIVS